MQKDDFEVKRYNGIEFEVIAWDSYKGTLWKLWQAAQRAAADGFAAFDEETEEGIVMYQVWLKSSLYGSGDRTSP